jgi:hypothetical protein
MKRSVKEKYAYNKNRDSRFSSGYCVGVKLYSDYPKADSEYKAVIRDLITNAKTLARTGDLYGKGIMCAVRDSADERKTR